MAWERQYGEQDCIKALQRVAEKLERPPTTGTYVKAKHKREPSAVTIMTYFGGWNNALTAADLRSRKSSNRAGSIKHTDSELLSFVAAANIRAEATQDRLTTAKYDQVRDSDWACGSGIRRRLRKEFGTWPGILKAASAQHG
jgi:hypothetical protein